MDLLEQVQWVTDAVSSKDVGASALTSFLLRDGYIHASDGRMVVGAPFPFEGSCLVPAKEFTRVLKNKPDGDFTWEFEPDRLVLHRGRFKGRIKFLPPEGWVLPTSLPPDMVGTPDRLIDAFELLIPFISENATKPWALCLGIVDGAMYASNNIAVACVELDPGTPNPYIIPRWVLEFVLDRREGLKSWHCGDTTITFLWENGSWMRSTLIEDAYPPVKRILDQYTGDLDAIDVEITPTWRKTLLRVCKITEDAVIRLRADGVHSVSGEVLAVEDDASTPVPEGHEETLWDIRFLAPVLEVATHWNPRVWPNPAPWRGDGIRGIIAARRP